MPVLHLENVPAAIYEGLHRLATAHNLTPEAEAINLLRQGLLATPPGRSQAELLADLHRRRFTPPPGTPDSVELLGEDRGR